jgi:hypothetical protein
MITRFTTRNTPIALHEKIKRRWAIRTSTTAATFQRANV